MANQIKKEAECPICLEILKKPIRILKCGHNLCEVCLHNLITSRQQNRCPVCRKEIDSEVPAEDFPRNHAVENMIEKVDSLSVAPIVKLVQEEFNFLSGNTLKQLKDLAKSYEQKEQLNEAFDTWQTIIRQCQHIDKILPLVSAIACLLKIGRLDEAIVFGVELVSLLESTADQIHRIKDECDLGICNLVKKFLEFKMFNMIFQLLQCRFNLLKRHYNVEIKFIKIGNVGVLMKNVARVVRSCDEIELFKQQYEFLDKMLLFMQNSRANEITGKIKGKTVALFLHDYGQCCVEVKDFVKAVIICSQAIASWKITFGNESNGYKTFSHFYNTLGWALEHSCHFLEAKTAYQTSIEINEQVRDYKNEKEKNRSDSERTNNLQRIEKRLKKI